MLNIERIKQLIPHRYPMLLVDEVTELGERTLSARKAITANEPWYANLPADAPAAAYAYPAAFVLESWCQAACVLAAAGQQQDAVAAGQVALFGSVSDLTLHGAVMPGDVLRHEVRLVKSLGDTWIFEGETFVDDTVLLTVGTAITALRPAEVIGC